MKTIFFGLASFVSVVLMVAPSANAQQLKIDWIAAGHSGYITSMVYAPDGTFFVTTAAGDPHAIVWDGSTAKFRNWFTVPTTVLTSAISSDRKFIAFGTDSAICVFDLASQTQVFNQKDSNTFHSQYLRFSATGDTLYSVTVSADTLRSTNPNGVLTIYSLNSGTSHSTPLPNFEELQTSGFYYGEKAAFTKDFKRILYTNAKGITLLSLANDSVEWYRPVVNPTSNVSSLAFIDHDSVIIASTASDSIVLLNPLNGSTLLGRSMAKITTFDNAFDIHELSGDSIAIVAQNDFFLLDARTLDTIRTFSYQRTAANAMTEWSPDNRYLLTGTTRPILSKPEAFDYPEVVIRTDLRNGFRNQMVTAINHGVYAARYSPAGGLIGIGSRGISFLDTSGNVLFAQNNEQEATSIAFSADGKLAAANTFVFGAVVPGWTGLELFNTADFSLRDSFPYYKQATLGSPLNQLNFSTTDSIVADGPFIVPFGNNSATIEWPETSYVNAYMPDGSAYFAADSDEVVRYDGKTGRAIDSFATNHQLITAMDISTDGSKIATCGVDTAIRVWSLPSYKFLVAFSGHGSPITGVKFSPDGGYVLSSSLDETLKVHDVSAGTDIFTYSDFAEPYIGMDITSDGKHVLGVTSNAVVQFALDLPLSVSSEKNGESDLSLQNYPNPFDGGTTIRFNLTKRENVSLNLYDLLGRKRLCVIDGMLDAGMYNYTLNNSNQLAEGSYFLTLNAGAVTRTKLLEVVRAR